MIVENKAKSDVIVRKYIDSLPKDEWTVFSVPKISKKLKLSPTTVKFRLEILRALGVIEVDAKCRKFPKIKVI